MTKDAIKAELNERKAKLILDGSVYRLQAMRAKENLRQSMRVDSLLRSAVVSVASYFNDHVMSPLWSTKDQRQKLVPLAIAIFSACSRKTVPRILAIGGILIGAIVLLVRRQKN